MVSASNFISVDKNNLTIPVNGFLPKLVKIPLCTKESDLTEILVKEGDLVKEGEVIAKLHTNYIHSSVPGKIIAIKNEQFSNGKQGLCAFIETKGSFSFLGKKLIKQNWSNYDSSSLNFLFKEAGIYNTFYKNESLFHQINKSLQRNGSTLVVRLFDEDPSYITESFVSVSFRKQIVEGVAAIAKAFKAKAVVFALALNDSTSFTDEQVISEIKSFYNADFNLVSVIFDTKKYPSGSMRDIVHEVKKNHKDKCIEFEKLGRKDLFIDALTALNAYNCVAYNMPVISTYIHITGDCLNAAAVMNVKTGTQLKDLVEQCGGFKRKLFKIVINGLLKGTSVSSLELPVSSDVKSVEFIPVHQASYQKTVSCVRCGNCRKICPAGLWPGNIYRVYHLSENEKLSLNTKTISDSAVLCSQCALCNSVCPSRLPLSQTIELLKNNRLKELEDK